jgi:hypothetical protein
VDPVRRLTLALLLALVAALGASADDVLDDDRRMTSVARTATRASREPPARLVTHTVYDERRCTERGLGGTPVSLAELVRRP